MSDFCNPSKKKCPLSVIMKTKKTTINRKLLSSSYFPTISSVSETEKLKNTLEEGSISYCNYWCQISKLFIGQTHKLASNFAVRLEKVETPYHGKDYKFLYLIEIFKKYSLVVVYLNFIFWVEVFKYLYGITYMVVYN